jgi:hypothetical protein
MSIDRIGKSGPPPAAPEATVPVSRPSNAPFSVGGVSSPGAPAQTAPVSGASAPTGAAAPGAAGVGPTEAGPLAQLRSGAIDLGQYLDVKVAEATAHLSQLPRAELDAVRGALRERLASDPTLLELTRVVSAAARSTSSPER